MFSYISFIYSRISFSVLLRGNFPAIARLLTISVLLGGSVSAMAERDGERGGQGFRHHSDRQSGREAYPRRERAGEREHQWNRTQSRQAPIVQDKPKRPLGQAYSTENQSDTGSRHYERKERPASREHRRHEVPSSSRPQRSGEESERRQQHRNQRRDDNSQHRPILHSDEKRREQQQRHSPRRELTNRHDRGERKVERQSRFHYKPRRQVTYRHSYHGQPKYRLHRRHRYVYYRSPWYHTRYLAPISVHYHPVGYRIHRIPHHYIRIYVSNLPFFYFGGIYYRELDDGYIVVDAPIGAVVTELPLGYIAFNNGFDTYFYVNSTYYRWSDSETAFVVVAKPNGADEAVEEATRERIFAYPNAGQSEEQQAKDRYECHQWAVSETNVDPTLEDENEELALEDVTNYRRALSACLEGRDYSVK